MNIKERFSDKNLDQSVISLNERLNAFLKRKKGIKNLLIQYFEKCNPREYDDGIKKFNLETWSGNEANPTLEIVQVDGEIKFGMTHYSILGPLKIRPAVSDVIKDFFINPKKYIKVIDDSPTTTTQLASLFDSFVKEKFKEILLDEDEIKTFCVLVGLKSIHLDLKIKKDSITESTVTELLYLFFETHGFYCDLINEDKPHWDVYVFCKNKSRIGVFNSDIYPKASHDNLLITISPRFN